MLVPELRSDRSNKPDGTSPGFPAHDAWLVGSQRHPRRPRPRDPEQVGPRLFRRQHPFRELAQPQCWSKATKRCCGQTWPTRPHWTKLIRRFLDYELPEIQEFRDARQQFKDDLPAVLESLRETIVDAEASNVEYQGAAQLFLDLCHQSISPKVTNDNVQGRC